MAFIVFSTLNLGVFNRLLISVFNADLADTFLTPSLSLFAVSENDTNKDKATHTILNVFIFNVFLITKILCFLNVNL